MFDFRSICKLLKFYHLKFGIKTRYFFDDFFRKPKTIILAIIVLNLFVWAF